MSLYVFHAEQFLEVYKRAQDIPQRKYECPQTEAQEIGWDTKPLVRLNHEIHCWSLCKHRICEHTHTHTQIDPLRNDTRLHHPRTNSEITKYMDAAWRQKEQENLQQ